MKFKPSARRITSFFLAVILLVTFMVPASAMDFDDLATVVDVTGQDSYSDADPDDPDDSSGVDDDWYDTGDDGVPDDAADSENADVDADNQESSEATPTQLEDIPLGASGDIFSPLPEDSGVIYIGANGIAPMASAGPNNIYYTADWSVTHVWPFSGGTTNYPIYKFYTGSGETAYCIEPYKFNSQLGHAVTGEMTYASLSTHQKTQIAKASEANSAGHGNTRMYAAAQTIIWEICAGQSHRSGSIYSAVITKNGLSSEYESIMSTMQTLGGEIPSFMSSEQSTAPLELMTESGGTWTTSALPNTNSNVTLRAQDFASLAPLSYNVSGNTLTITSNSQPGTDAFVTWSSLDGGEAIIFWCNASIQDKATVNFVPGTGYLRLHDDAVPPPPPEEPEPKIGQLGVRKTHAFDGSPLSGAEFTVESQDFYMEGWAPVNASDVLAIPIPDGQDYVTVRVTETKAPDGFQLSGETKSVDVYPMEIQNIYWVDFANTPEPGELIIVKHEVGKEDVRLSGATFRIRFTSPRGHDFEETYTTGSDGRIVIEIPCEGTAVITELVPPSGYQLSETTEWTRIFENGTKITLSVANPKNAELIVYKRDNQSGALLGGAEIHAYLEESFTEPKVHGVEYVEFTQAGSGKAVFTNLIPGLYRVWEESPPANYNGTSEVFNVRVEDDSVETVEVVFRNDPFTGIAAIKVDENDPEKRIMGAVFALYRGADENKVLIKEVTSDENGIAHFGVQPVGLYYTIIEKTPPFGYELDEEPSRTIFLEAHQEDVLVTLVYKNPPKPKFLLIKEDMEGKRLSNAVFALRKVGTDEVYHITTGHDGTVLTENLSEGFWQILEVRSPEGHLIASTEWSEPFELKRGITHTITAQNARKPSLKLLKTDENGAPLSGAVFVLAKEDSNEYFHLTSGPDGYALAENLEDTWYTLWEIRAPDNMVLSNEKITLTFEPNQVLEYTFVNYSKPKQVIRKVDEQHPDVGIEGVTIRIWPEDMTSYRDYVTGPGGYIEIQLEPGRYFYQERVAAPGYILDETVRSFVVDAAGGEYNLLITNRKKPSLTIYKYCSVTKQPLQATFEVLVKNGRSLGTFTTDPDTGELTLDDLDYTTDPLILEIVETIGPDGYLITDERKEITISWGESARIEWPNTPENPILIYKYDSATGEVVPNTEFLVTKVDGTYVGTYKSGRNGIAVVGGQQPGWYLVTETKVASENYILDPEPKLVQLRYKEPAVLEVYNDRLPELEILKVNKADNTPMQGVKIRVQYKTGELIGDFYTDHLGKIQLQVRPEWVTCYELETLPGFKLDQSPVDVLPEVNKTVTVRMENIPIPGFQLQKVDSVTQEPLKSVQYEIRRLDQSLIGIFETDDQGIIYLNIDETHIVITEIKSLSGYKIDTESRTVELRAGELVQLRLQNHPYPILELVKRDAQSKEPLASVKFKLFDQYMREIGTYTTNQLGRIVLTGMSEGKFYLQEYEPLPSYQHDRTVHEIFLYYGRTTAIELDNHRMGNVRLRKISAETGEALPNATYLIYDAKGNILGEYTTNYLGLIELEDVEPQKLRLKEIKAPPNHVLDDTMYELVVEEGATAELVLKNEPERGRIQIVKVAAADSPISKIKKGDGLAKAIFEVFDEDLNLVDTIETDKRGIGTSDYLPLGRYVLKETRSPDYFFTDGSLIYAEIKLHDDLIQFTVENEPEDIDVEVEKRGIVECMPGDVIDYTFSNIRNASNCDLDEFYWADTLPVDAVRIESLNTGTWTQSVKFDVYIQTNLKSGWRKIESNLSSKTANTIDMTSTALKLASNEYVVSYKLVFGEVGPDFHEDQTPFITCRVLEGLTNGYRFVNRTEVGGRRNKEWAYAKDSWVTVVFVGKKCLPKTGI